MKVKNSNEEKAATKVVGNVNTNNKSSFSHITGKSKNTGYRRIKKPLHPVNIHYYG